MARWQTGARDRLEQAALALFLEQGFSETTVPQIAERAGLTTRTFFRHFADKREVLFAGDDAVPALFHQLLTRTPAQVLPVPLILSQLGPFAESVFGAHRDILNVRTQIIRTDQGLTERKFQKMAAIKASVTQGFVERGSDPLSAMLAADLAMTVMETALTRWLAPDNTATLSAVVAEVLASLRQLVSVPELTPAP